VTFDQMDAFPRQSTFCVLRASLRSQFLELDFSYSPDSDLWRINTWIPNMNEIQSRLRAQPRHIYIHTRMHTAFRNHFLVFERSLKTCKKYSYHCNKPSRPIGLWDVEAPTFSRQLGRPLPPGRFLVLISVRLSRPQGHNAAGRIRSIETSNDLIGNLTGDLPACSIVSQPTTLPRVPPENM
jgi:hypothetical protein